jgi:hypothetical protein
LFNSLKKIPNQVKTVISASAIGYYGMETYDNWCGEDQSPGKDFVASVAKVWEESILPIKTLGIRLVTPRIGVVLSNKGGALIEISKSVKWFVGAPLGSGNQWVSWIHIDDLCKMFLYFLENESSSGIYNLVAPNPVTNRELTKIIARTLHRPLLLPPVPDFVLRIILGEMAGIVITGPRVLCEKIMSTGFQFEFKDASVAVENLL